MESRCVISSRINVPRLLSFLSYILFFAEKWDISFLFPQSSSDLYLLHDSAIVTKHGFHDSTYSIFRVLECQISVFRNWNRGTKSSLPIWFFTYLSLNPCDCFQFFSLNVTPPDKDKAKVEIQYFCFLFASLMTPPLFPPISCSNHCFIK